MTPDLPLPHEPRPIRIGQALVLLFVLGLLVNPPLANLAQAALIVLFAVSSTCRRRLGWALRQPAGAAVLVLLAVFAVGVTYGEASRAEALGTLWGWRKMLMLPVAMALLRTARSRFVLASAFVAACAVAAAASFVFWALKLTPALANTPGFFGIVLRNHSTQSAMFSVAVFAAATCALLVPALSRRSRLLFTGAALLIVANLLLVTPGRTGYVALLVCMGALVWGWGRTHGRSAHMAALASVAIVALTLAALFAVPASRSRIEQAVTETQEYSEQTQLTSMGIRVIFWRNTLPIIGERPWLGWGTGSFEEAYRRHVQGKTGVGATVTRDPHNQYLGIAAENGLPALALFIGFIVLLLRQQPGRNVFRILGTGVLAAWCVTSLANSHFAMFSEGGFLYVWLGAMLGPLPTEDLA